MSIVYQGAGSQRLREAERTPLLGSSINGEDNEGGSHNGSGFVRMHISEKEYPPFSEDKAPVSSGKGPNRAIQITLLTVALQSVGFTLVLPSMYLYLSSLHGDDSFYGYVVAVYSVGSLLGSILFGWWYDKRPVREPVLVGLVITFVGNALYSILPFFSSGGPWLMFAARFLVGFGSGNVAVCRAYCSEVTPLKNKVAMMAAVSGAQGIGFVIGPGLGSVVSFVNFRSGSFLIDSNTSPGYLSCIFCLTNFLLVLFFLKGNGRRDNKSTNPSDDKPVRSSDEPLLPVFVTLFLFFSSVSVFAIFETDFTILSNKDFGWGASKNSVYFLLGAIVSTVVYVVIATPKFKKMDEKKAASVGFALLICGMLCFIVYNKPFHLEDKLTLYQLIAGGVLFSIGYPIASTFIFGLYSKMLNPKVQGSKMGWITASGSLARMLGPIWASHTLNDPRLGDSVTFGGTALFLVFTLLGLGLCSHMLVPHRDYGKPTDGTPYAKLGNEVPYSKLGDETPASAEASLSAL